MRDINTIYREEVAASNEEYTKTVGDSVQNLGDEMRKAMEIFRIGMEKFSGEIMSAAQKHLARVSAAEISWTTSAEVKMAQFQGIPETRISEPETPKSPETKETPEQGEPITITVTSVKEEDNDPVPSFLTRKKLPPI